jgi:predicted DCC family thiol-disulfide oxidoreductase YuxK
MYRGLEGAGAMNWINIADPAYSPPAGTTRQQLMARFHVVTAEGRLVSGARAFIHVWSHLAGWKHLAKIARIPGIPTVLEVLYRFFLILRPIIQNGYSRVFPSTPNAEKSSITRSQK